MGRSYNGRGNAFRQSAGPATARHYSSWIQTVTTLFCILGIACSLHAQTKQPVPPIKAVRQHAAISVLTVAVAPVVHPKRTLKEIFGSVLFGVETGVDGVHAVTSVANNIFVNIPPTIPVLDIAGSIVKTVDVDSGKLDVWLERQEDFLFGMHN
jgi:hypothetical protein